MSLGLLYWILMLLWAIGGVGWGWRGGPWPVANGVLPFLLFLILGWQAFGPPIK